MKDLIIPNSWCLKMKDGITSILAGLQHQIDNWRLVTYPPKRDEYRAKLAIPRPPRWTDTTPALAAQVNDVHKSSLPQASYRVKLTWDKHCHMGNQAKAAHTAEKLQRAAHLSAIQGGRLTTTLDQGLPRINPPTDTIRLYCSGKSRHTKGN